MSTLSLTFLQCTWCCGGVKFWVFLYYVQECVPIMFSKGSSSSHYMPQDVPNCTTLLFHTLCPKLSFQLYKWAKWETPSSFSRKFYIGELLKFQFSFVVFQSKWLIAKKKKKEKKKKFKLGEPPNVCDGNKSWIWTKQIVNVLMGGYLHYLSSKFVKKNFWTCGIHKYEVSHPL